MDTPIIPYFFCPRWPARTNLIQFCPAYNLFLNFWTEIGLIGLSLFLLFLVYIVCSLRNLFLEKNILAWPLSLAWSTWFIHGLVDVPYFKNDLSILFFIFLALTLIAGHSWQKTFLKN